MAKLLALRAANLFDGESARLVEHPLVLIEQGRIKAIENGGTTPPANAELHDLGDATLVPGLIDAHVHLAFASEMDAVESVTAPDHEVLGRIAEAAGRALKAGITTVRDLGDRDYLVKTFRDQSARAGEIIPTILTAGAPITPTGGHCWFLGGEADGVDGVRAAVVERAQGGVDLIKVMATGGLMTPGYGMHEAQYDEKVLRALVEEAESQGLSVAAHAHGAPGIRNAVQAAVGCVEHCTFVTEAHVEADWRAVDDMVERGTFIGATEAWSPDGPAFPEAAASRLEQVWENFVTMHRRGARVVISSDAGVGARKPHDVLPHGAVHFAGRGFGNVEALRSVTSLAADACGVGSRKGRLAPGYDADVLAVSGNPIADIRSLLRPHTVIRGGRLVPTT